MQLQDYRRNVDYLRPASAAAIALADRYTDYRPSVPTVQAKPVGWWEGAVVMRAALALGLGTFISSIGGAVRRASQFALVHSFPYTQTEKFSRHRGLAHRGRNC